MLKGFTFQSHDWSEKREIASILDIQRLHDIELSTVEVTKIAQTEFDIPIRSHPLVDHYLTLFQGRGRRFFQRWLDKSEIFIPIMAPILASYDLPADIVYLAMIESGYSGTATSPAAAAGFWQFMPATGRQYGLRQNHYVDERRDFILATLQQRAFTRLYHKFGDWHLAFASYNAGDGRIGRALKKHRVDNYGTSSPSKEASRKKPSTTCPSSSRLRRLQKTRRPTVLSAGRHATLCGGTPLKHHLIPS